MTLSPGEQTSWAVQFAEEQARLLGALRHVTDGGVVEQIAHVGATSMPGLALVEPGIALAAAVWPFPLDEGALQKLTELGYQHSLYGYGRWHLALPAQSLDCAECRADHLHNRRRPSLSGA